jgi:hypothetical protein
MMPQREANELPRDQAAPAYGHYEGDQAYTRQHNEAFYQQLLSATAAEKVYVLPPDNKNVLRLVAFGMAMVTLIIFAVICLIIVGGSAGWISFCAASLSIFIVAVVAIDKIK